MRPLSELLVDVLAETGSLPVVDLDRNAWADDPDTGSDDVTRWHAGWQTQRERRKFPHRTFHRVFQHGKTREGHRGYRNRKIRRLVSSDGYRNGKIGLCVCEVYYDYFDRNADADSKRYADRRPDCGSNCDADAHTDTHSDADADTHTDAHADTNGNNNIGILRTYLISI